MQETAEMDADNSKQGVAPDKAWIGWLQIGAIAGVIALALFLTVVLSSGRENAPAPAPDRNTVPVELVQPRTTSHAVTVTLTGTVAARANVALTPQVSGRVMALSENVRTGARFNAGEILFEIDPHDYEIAVARAGAAVADAQSALDQLEAEAAINRVEWRREYPDREITPLAAREPQLLAARARLTSAQADLAQAQLNLERTRIQFPFDGRVIDSQIEIGQLVAAGQSYGAVYDSARLEVVAPIPPADLARLDGAQGRNARLSITETGQVLDATIDREGAILDDRTRFIDLFITPGQITALRPGQFIEVDITGPHMNAVMALPEEALVGLNTVRIVRDGDINEVRVNVLDRPRSAVIVTPFDTGEGVVVTPVPESALGRPARILSAREN